MKTALTLFFSLCMALYAEDWPKYAGPLGNNHSSEVGLISSFPGGKANVLWRKKANLGYSGMAIEKGVVYFPDREASESNKEFTETLTAYDLKSGKQLWKYSAGEGKRVSFPGNRNVPAIDGDRVYFSSPNGAIYCLNKASGELKWKTHLIKEHGGKQPQFGYCASPLIYKNLYIAGLYTSKGWMIAFDKITGKKKWVSQPMKGNSGYATPAIMKIDDKDYIFSSSGIPKTDPSIKGRAVGIDPLSGKYLWTSEAFQSKIVIPSPIKVRQNRFVITSGYNAGTMLFDMVRSGSTYHWKRIWHNKKGLSSQFHLPLVIDGYIYAVDASNKKNNGLICLDANGNKKWSTGDNESQPNFGRGPCVYADGKIYIMESDTGYLHIIKPAPSGYKELGKARIFKTKPTWAPMALSDGKLAIRNKHEIAVVAIK